MKKFLTVFSIMLCMMCMTVSAQNTQVYKATSYAFAEIYYGDYNWSDWSKCNIQIVFSMSNDIVTIYSKKKQTYKIVDVLNDGEVVTDYTGGQTLGFVVIDQDYDKGHMRLRVESNGNSQIYIDFNDVAWVYNVIRIK